jgi:hypothetical protein
VHGHKAPFFTVERGNGKIVQEILQGMEPVDEGKIDLQIGKGIVYILDPGRDGDDRTVVRLDGLEKEAKEEVCRCSSVCLK